MFKKIIFLTIGTPDPSLSGSGIVNYLICDYFLRHGIKFKAVFRLNKNFHTKFVNNKYIDELITRGLEYEVVYNNEKDNRFFSWGFNYIKRNHQYSVCHDYVAKLDIGDFDAAILFDMGWAFAMANVDLPKFCFFSDPIQGIMEFNQQYYFYNPISVRRWLLAQSVRGLGVYRKIQDAVGRHITISVFSKFDRDVYLSRGVRAEYFRTFTPNVAPLQTNKIIKSKITCLHVGTLQTTASVNMLRFWREDLLPNLAKLPYQTEIRLVGRDRAALQSKWPNVKITFLGYIDHEQIEVEYKNANFFLSPMKYPIGVRTRIVVAMSYGLPAVAHYTAGLGMPELKDGQHILYGWSGKEMAEKIRYFIEDKNRLQELSCQARIAWETWYDAEKNISCILAELNKY